MSNCTTIGLEQCNIYPLRKMARVFAGVGLATMVYALTLVAIAFESVIIEF